MNQNIHKIAINNKNYGKLDGVEIFLTEDLYEALAKKPRDGTTVLKQLEVGRAVQGLKHLIATIKGKNKNSNIILNLDKTKKDGDDYFINYNEYREKGQKRFFSLYKETGFDAALSYLNTYFPQEFEYDKNQLKESELNKVDKQLPDILTRVFKKSKNQLAIIEATTKAIAELKYKNKASKNALLKIQKRTSLSFYQQRLEEFKSRLTKDYPETRGKNSWQKWIYNNHWLFGIQYLESIQKERIGFDNIPDFLFPTLDGFIDILEIKKPNFEVIREDTSHPGAYAWGSETNKAIGQVVNYLQNMELRQLELRDRIEDKYKHLHEIAIYPIKPRAFILIGVQDNWNASKKKSFRTMNYSLHGIEVLTYSDLILRGESLISMLSAEYTV